jgi:hypothetical protein
MDLTFLYLPGFVREWDRQRLTADDLVSLEQEIQRQADRAPVVRGTGGLRKIRFAPPSRHTGKRGATRVGFAYFHGKAAVVVAALFAKNEAANFTAAERAEIAELLKRVARSFR